MMENYFTSEDVWTGGGYELALELGPRSDERLQAALQAIWEEPFLQGCYLRLDVEPEQQSRLAPSLEALESSGPLRGLATLPNGKRVACATCAVREEEGSDWLDLFLPLGSLGSAYAVGAFPFDDSSRSREWREPLDGWLTSLGQRVFARVPYALGLIGFEVSGQSSTESWRKPESPRKDGSATCIRRTDSSSPIRPTGGRHGLGHTIHRQTERR